ncbi:AraC family transcriptional regulator [Kribbella sp. NBC_00709]|uniref:helix-turn-helix transcriptional regulator n=1 Tax=Kribbella sp. NBC_00709 TaxID=2975972 RepID=UPI002E27B5D1|nr:AraC family transcriptional regulator [Kribbella sp. NBC_00709]
MAETDFRGRGRRPAARFDIGGLRHQELDSEASLGAPGPLWFLVLGGAVTLRTAAGTSELGVGDAAWLDSQTGFTVTTAAGAELAAADLRVVVAAHAIPSPLVVRGFAARHPGVAELVKSCPLDGHCRASTFGEGYGTLIGAAMTDSWLEDEHPEADEVDPLVTRVLEAVVADPAGQWSVESLATLAHLSRSALNTRFQKALGRSPIRMLRDVRMGEARLLLADPGLPVEAVASRCGYGSIAAFSRAFTSEHGLSPQSWRAELRQVRGVRSTAKPTPLTTATAAPSTSAALTP